MLTLLRSLACLAFLLSAGLAHAVDIDLKNADGTTKSRLTGTGADGAADVSQKTCTSGESACEGTSAAAAASYVMVRGALPKATVAVAAETTNTTSATFTLPAGSKTPVVVSTAAGAQAHVFNIFGAGDSTAANGEWLCTVNISVSTKDVKTCNGGHQITRDFPYYYYVSSGATGSPTSSLTFYNGLTSPGAPSFADSGLKVADALIKTGAGFLQCIWIAQHDASPTAGTISINDATSAGTGTVIWEWVLTTAVFSPFQICPQRPFSTGLYFDFTTTGDVNASASYR